ncbi:cytochrome c [Actibacterium sp. XHP0104]|uniref:cytochrome c n=1 Tax=Actibacterium sp. XHP0104 TaxID=2984335 RepID=UPI0021E87403|nr:cytochrome c [Actibacterium sp. XHP0104]MCV2881037.1 cytochrome c [Actibacterium sp. XHP0104]
MKRLVISIAGLALIGLAVFWMVTRPRPLDPQVLAALAPGDAVRGEQVFWASGCASCHAAPEATGDDKLLLGGGQRFASPFGTFLAPNISPDATHGIGGWTMPEFANAVMRGISPEGAHYYPAFPYTSYMRAEPQDIADLKAFMDGLPTVATPSQPHEVGFPFNIRRSLGGWKFLFAKPGWVMNGDMTAEVSRGRYLVEALGHCGECHTPRNALGGIIREAWLSGAPTADGKGKVPGIAPAQLNWSARDIAYYLETGFTPEFDSVGGHMASVVDNMAKLTAEDRAAIAAYLKALPES